MANTIALLFVLPIIFALVIAIIVVALKKNKLLPAGKQTSVQKNQQFRKINILRNTGE